MSTKDRVQNDVVDGSDDGMMVARVAALVIATSSSRVGLASAKVFSSAYRSSLSPRPVGAQGWVCQSWGRRAS